MRFSIVGKGPALRETVELRIRSESHATFMAEAAEEGMRVFQRIVALRAVGYTFVEWAGIVPHVKPVACALCILWATLGMADRFVLTPTGKKLPYRSFRLEHLWNKDHPESSQTFLGAGIATSFDAEVTLDRVLGRDDRVYLDFSYSYIEPILENPGFSFGLRDLTNDSPSGRSIYFAGTWYAFSEGKFTADTPIEVSIGYQAGTKRTGFFVNALVPFAYFLRGMVEYDLFRVAVGLEIKPSRSTSIRWLQSEGEGRLSVNLIQRL